MSIKSFCVAATLSIVLGGALAGTANADTLHFMATLKGGDETPPTSSTGTGMVMATLDTSTKAFHYHVTYAGLTGPGVAAHFHLGAPGVKGPPVVPVTGSVASPISGEATLTDAQATSLEAGDWYFNVHTAANPGGEIRGQVLLEK